MTPVEKCFIHRLIDSFTEFLFERLMGDHRYFGLCRGCTVAKQNFLEHLGVLTVGHAKLPLHFPGVAGRSLSLQRYRRKWASFTRPNSRLQPIPRLIVVGTQPLITAKALFY